MKFYTETFFELLRQGRPKLEWEEEDATTVASFRFWVWFFSFFPEQQQIAIQKMRNVIA
jgi:hypothetical protein